VLIKTMPTLQGANTKEQRLASLTTKLTLAQGVEVQQQLCNSQLHHELQDRLWQCGQLETQVSTLQQHLSASAGKLAAAQSQHQLAQRELHALKAEVVEREQQLAQAHAVQQQQQQHTADLEEEMTCYTRSLQEQRARHAEQIKELCAQAQEEEERQRSRAMSTQWHELVIAAQREIVEFAVEKLVFRPSQQQLARSGAAGEEGKMEEVSQEMRQRLGAAVADMSVQVEHLVRSKLVMEWQLRVKDRKTAALQSALDQSLSAQALAENRCLAQQQRARAQAAAEDAHAWSRVEALEHRVCVLSEQLESTNTRAIQLSASLKQAQEDRDAAAAAAETLQRRHSTLLADHQVSSLCTCMYVLVLVLYMYVRMYILVLYACMRACIHPYIHTC
jgi:hypothetical protein